jgi:hypothetical protein
MMMLDVKEHIERAPDTCQMLITMLADHSNGGEGVDDLDSVTSDHFHQRSLCIREVCGNSTSIVCFLSLYLFNVLYI